MKDKTRDELVAENEELRRRVASLQKVSQGSQSAAALLQAAPLGIHECDTEGRITFVNPSQEAITGYTADELVGTYVWDRIEPGPEKDSLPAYFKYLVSEQPLLPTPFFATNIRKNGEVFDVRIDWNYKRDQQGQVTGFVSIVSDITERKQAEEALRESEERYRLLSEAIPQLVWRTNAEGEVIECNRRWCEYTGQTPDEAKGFGGLKAMHPDDVEKVTGRVREAIAGGQLYQAEYRLRQASDGNYHWHLARAIPRRDANGTILGWFGCATDIDDQKRAEEALVEREARLLEAQEVAQLGFYVHDIAKAQWTSSSVLDRIFGIPADYPRTSEGWGDLVHPQERQTMLDYLAEEVVGEKKPFDREYRIVRYRDKQVRWVHGRGRLQFSQEGQPVYMLGTIQDITDRKGAEEALRESERRFRAIFEQAPLGIGLLDSHTGHFVRINPRYCEIAGRTEEEMLKLDYQSITHPDDLQLCLNNVASLVEGKVRSCGWEKRYLRPDGSLVWVNLTIVAMWDEGDHPRFHLTMVEDITERKRVEEALRKAHDELERRVEERTADLSTTAKRLQCEVEERRRAESTLDAFFNASTAILNILDDEFRYIKTDSLTPTYFGLNAQSIVGKSLKDDLAPQFIEEYGSMVRRVMETGEPLHNVEVKSPVPGRPEEVLYWRASYFPIPLPKGKRGYGVVGIEINDIMRAEAALAESEAKHRQLIETTDTGYLILDDAGRVVDANREYVRLTGHHDLREIIGHSVMEWTAPYDRDRNAREVEQCIQVGRVRQLEVDYIGPERTVTPVEINATVITTPEGKHILSLCRDITERRLAQEALRQERRTLLIPAWSTNRRQ